MPNTRAAGKAAIRNMDSRIDMIGGQLQKQLDELKSSVIMGPNSSADAATEEFAGARRALLDFEEMLRRTLGELKSEVAAIVASVQKELEDMRRQSYANHLILQGLKESDEEDVYQKVCEFLNSKIDIGLSVNDLSSCYRLGRKLAGGDKVRAVAVHFVHRWKRDKIYSKKRLLKGTGVVVYEMLTGYKFTLLKKVKQLLGVKNCWTSQGNVYAKINGTKTKIGSETDIPRPIN